MDGNTRVHIPRELPQRFLGMLFTGIVAIICPIDVTQVQRDVLSKGLTSNGAKLLDIPYGDGERVSPSDLVPNGCQLFMNAARNSSKRKRSGVGGGERSSSKRSSGVSSVSGKTSEDGPTPTHVFCDAGAFRAGRVSHHLEGIFSRYPLIDEASSVKVIGSGWLSECLRRDAQQPLGSHLLQTITRANPFTPPHDSQKQGNGKGTGKALSTVMKSSSTTKSSSSARNLSSGKAGGAKTGGKNPWTASATTNKNSAKKKEGGGGGGGSSSQQLGVGAGPGGARGPGGVLQKALWKDETLGSGDGSGGEGRAATGAGVGRNPGGKWEELIGGAVLRWVPQTQRVSTHILAFDMDGTLIKTKSGKRFGDGEEDWELLHANTTAALKAWYEKGYKVAIISNQLGVGKGKVDKRALQSKVESIVRALKVPVEAYLACEDDYYRKPRPGCWELLSSVNNGDFNIVSEACLYVGDAAGRPKEGPRKKDFSSGDLKLAINVGVPFQTPEQFFLGSNQRLHRDRSLASLGFDPSTLRYGRGDSSSSSEKASSILETLSKGGGGKGKTGLEVIVLVGPPSSGKSTLCKDRLQGYIRVNQDELSTLAKCRRVATEHLKKGESVVIDATNPKRQTRSDWISLAREHGAQARCIFLETPKEACFHLNAFRGCHPSSPEKERRMVPDVVIHSWFKNVESVDSTEGFNDVIHVPFALREFDESQQKECALLLMHLLPK